MEDRGFWIGHQMLGDVIGFVAAAHLYSLKIGNTVKVNFQESRKDITKYFSGVEWVPKDQITNLVDCGRNPTLEEWPTMNGVKRFYKWMDPTMTPTKSFDIHFNCKKRGGKKLIGLITHSNTQGDIPDHIVEQMLDDARKLYPDHTIVAIGNNDNKYIPKGVKDLRQKNGDILWIIEMVRDIDLLICPHTGPCFIAAGFKIPMWVYQSKEPFWDFTLNFDEYSVECWWERTAQDEYKKFDSLYYKGGWNGRGSGPGSNPDKNKEYLWLLHKIIDYTPNIKTIVDIGCGDWQLMKDFNLTKKYVGVDVSQIVIDKNKSLYTKQNVDFVCSNCVLDELPDGDLCIIKDVLQHLPNKDVHKVLNKLKKYKYCLMTNDYTDKNGGDIHIGEWRPINVLLSPFNVDGITITGYNGKHVVLKVL
jgi:hypothetical protein